MTPRCTLLEVSKKFRSQWALRGVTLRAAAGEVVGLVGPNGAGKTTLLRIAARLMHPHAGTVDIPSGPFGTIRYFAGERTLPPDVRVARWRRLWRLADDRQAGRKRMAALSRGMRQRLGLETVLSRPQSAALVLLDEPWEGLDPDAAAWLSAQLEEVRSAGGSTLVSSHRIHDLAPVCDRCVFINRGRVTWEIDVRMALSTARAALLFDAFEQSKKVKQ